MVEKVGYQPKMRINLLRGPARPPHQTYQYNLPNTREAEKALPTVYPFVPGREVQGKTVIVHRDALVMSDIPQMQREFLHVRREELLILKFIDIFHPIAKKYEEYNDVPPKEKRLLMEELEKIGLNIKDPENIRRLLSKILRLSAYRYPAAGYGPEDILNQLITCHMAGIENIEFKGSCGHGIVFHRIDNISDAKKLINWHVINILSDEEVERLARASLEMYKLFYKTNPIFFRRDQSFPPLIIMGKDARLDLPGEFIAGPSRFIEKQENVQRDKKAEQFIYLNTRPHDVSRVKRFTLGGIPIISKRVEPLRVSAIEEEIGRARAIEEKIKANGIENCRVAQYLGLVYDQGNFYLLMRDEEAPSLYEKGNKDGKAVFEQVKQVLSNGDHQDLEPRNALWNGKELILIDFEEHASAVRVENLPPTSNPLLFARLSKASMVADLKPILDHHGDNPLISRFDAVLRLRNITSKKKIPSLIAIGDIHGNNKRLAEILNSDPGKRVNRFIFLGDYFDRDAGGREVFELLRQRKNDIFLLGNHELYFLLAMKGDRVSFEKWISYGGLSFLAAALDLKDFRQAFDAIGENVEGGLIDTIERMKEENPRLLDEVYHKMINHPFLKEVYDWLTNTCRLFHIDEFFNLHVHAGVKLGRDLNLEYFDKLKKAEEAFLFLMRDPAASLSEVLAAAGKISPPMEMREMDWQEDLTQQDWQRAQKQLFNIGIRGVVYGHNPRYQVSERFGRLYGIDLSMAEHYGGHGGFLEIGTEGIITHRFAERESDRLEDKVLSNGQEFREEVRYDSEDLIRTYQEYFLRKIL